MAIVSRVPVHQFITDPEEFLSNPAYVLATIAEPRGSHALCARWKVIVLETRGEFLAPDAKHLKGQALSRLLNVCDGVLRQAMRALVLVTTNEPLRHCTLRLPARAAASPRTCSNGSTMSRWLPGARNAMPSLPTSGRHRWRISTRTWVAVRWRRASRGWGLRQPRSRMRLDRVVGDCGLRTDEASSASATDAG